MQSIGPKPQSIGFGNAETAKNGTKYSVYTALCHRVDRWIAGPWSDPEMCRALGDYLIVVSERGPDV